jgi:hypothetical protein
MIALVISFKLLLQYPGKKIMLYFTRRLYAHDFTSFLGNFPLNFHGKFEAQFEA